MKHQDSKSGLRSGGFTFKQFFVAHDRCAMKVGTDGIVLGAWAPLRSVGRILDIGCGSGVIALMLAQRSGGAVPVDAVELDAVASQQAMDNVSTSPWSDTINIYHADITRFIPATTAPYSLIVSNPPYFSPGVSCRTEQRAQARYTTTLTHSDLLNCAHRLLADDGLFCVVLPHQVVEEFLNNARDGGWHLRQRTDVAEYASRAAHRVLLALSHQPGAVIETSLVIRDDHQCYSVAFRTLTQDFYLFM
ncbi:tRNA1(Val) (adenine(37)-N6)-methyltransferase [Prodigiosinella confusarubida]|uniref:tRNA1(Val) (adenine(37)-N6)-methyltransferase n=1 Tax=Serratia sp. (strain ATCC 39006) TaxID=104623 RepID=A0A2I5T5R8_SERS3|nr:tRNA1(Val) (adenine(37)-N6)-methyltransferase [Serratia sp. ATCC 39006]AUG99895.1 tRNA1(Val) (adenine(37)-N6)-methyltransferase [Serratia sp. ATCC 39006]AUH04215.1 tRNA1(Val) (adenine(37)-N6)-methyltransferase [Serratia sp. ATCC 39006]